ncbi:hypothetical protein LINPERPRIM_LOCUS6989, partial [Linum perenne]
MNQSRGCTEYGTGSTGIRLLRKQSTIFLPCLMRKQRSFRIQNQ